MKFKNIDTLFNKNYIITNDNLIFLDLFLKRNKETLKRNILKVKRNISNKRIPINIKNNINKIINSYKLKFYNKRGLIKYDIDIFNMNVNQIENIVYDITFISDEMNYSLLKYLQDKIIFDKDIEHLNMINNLLEEQILNIKDILSIITNKINNELDIIKGMSFNKQFIKHDILFYEINGYYCLGMVFNRKIVIFDLVINRGDIVISKFIYINNFIFNMNAPLLLNNFKYKLKTIPKNLIKKILTQNSRLTEDIIELLENNNKITKFYKKDIISSNFFRDISKNKE